MITAPKTNKTTTYENAVNTYGYRPKIGATLGLASTRSRSKYKAIVRVVNINPKNLRVRLTEIKPENYDVGQEWLVNYFRPTKDNHLFYLKTNYRQVTPEEINEFNRKEAELEKLVKDRINQYWKTRWRRQSF
jgi:hypothetical protein